MEITPENYPDLFKELKKTIRSKIKKHGIRVNRKRFKENEGRARAWDRTIWIPVIKDIESIYVIFHEIAHIIKGHDGLKKPDYLQELEAELYALNEFRKFNLHRKFSKEFYRIRNCAMKDVTEYMVKDAEKGDVTSDTVDARALVFCKISRKKIDQIKEKATRRKKAKKHSGKR